MQKVPPVPSDTLKSELFKALSRAEDAIDVQLAGLPEQLAAAKSAVKV
jgi:hypothetical protein